MGSLEGCNSDGLNKAYIELKGIFKSETWVSISTKENPSNLMKLKQNKAKIRPKRYESKQFAKIISKGNVILHGIIGRKTIWSIELNYGNYWHGLEIQKYQKYSQSESDSMGANKKQNGIKQIPTYDVRDMRQQAIERPDISKYKAEFLRWLSHENLSLIHIPKWCQELALEIENRKNK